MPSALKLCLKTCLYVICLLSIFQCGITWADSSNNPSQPIGIEWQKGPLVANLGGAAQIKVPQGYAFTDGKGAKRFLELSQNPPSGNEVGLIIPIQKDSSTNNFWFMLFEFNEVGYIADTDKSSLDPDGLLRSLQDGTERDNKTRQERGWPAFHITGWQQTPFYDSATHNLTWGIYGQGDDASKGQTDNYSVRILGRRGEMSVDLILDPSQLATVLPTYNMLLQGFSYTSGNRYAEFVKGDKVAGYGLAALIAGGAAATAVKTGLVAKLWKLLLAAIMAVWKLILLVCAAIASFFRKLFAKLFRREKEAVAQVSPLPASDGSAKNDLS